jgi:hypothetical protein
MAYLKSLVVRLQSLVVRLRRLTTHLQSLVVRLQRLVAHLQCLTVWDVSPPYNGSTALPINTAMRV